VVLAIALLELGIKGSPHFSKPVTGVMQDSLTVPETGHSKI
jgi:hypothetical protein